MDKAGSWTRAEVEEWRKSFTARVDVLGFIVNYAEDTGHIHIYQAGNLFLQFRDPHSAVRWLIKEESERATRRAEAERVGSQPAWGSTVSVDFQPAQVPVSRDEFNELQSKIGLLSAQNAQILEMLKARPVIAYGTTTSGSIGATVTGITVNSGDAAEYGIEG
jgi:hypothetical protein